MRRFLYSGVLAAVAVGLAMGCGERDEMPVEPIGSKGATAELRPQQQIETPGLRPIPTAYSGQVPQAIVVTVTATPPMLAQPLPNERINNTATPVSPDGARNIDCADFETGDEAQVFFMENGGPLLDRFFMDTNNDGVACNSTGGQRV